MLLPSNAQITFHFLQLSQLHPLLQKASPESRTASYHVSCLSSLEECLNLFLTLKVYKICLNLHLSNVSLLLDSGYASPDISAK